MQVLDNGRRLSLVHRTPVGGIPGAMTAFKGRLLVGVNSALRIYDAGKKKLLRKTEYRGLPTHVSHLACMGERIFAGDLQVGAQMSQQAQQCWTLLRHTGLFLAHAG